MNTEDAKSMMFLVSYILCVGNATKQFSAVVKKFTVSVSVLSLKVVSASRKLSWPLLADNTLNTHPDTRRKGTI